MIKVLTVAYMAQYIEPTLRKDWEWYGIEEKYDREH